MRDLPSPHFIPRPLLLRPTGVSNRDAHLLTRVFPLPVQLVPILVYVQRIVRLVREQGDEAAIIGELLRSRAMLPWYIQHTFEGEQRAMLLQAYELRALIVLIDGIDEAAGMKLAIEDFVHKEVAVSGNRVVVTSRPEGVRLELYQVCHLLRSPQISPDLPIPPILMTFLPSPSMTLHDPR